MNLYRITLVGTEGETPTYRNQREHARMKAREAIDHRAARIDLIEINPKAEDIVDMLNGSYEFAAKVSAQRTWGMSPRGALVELQPGE